MPPKVFIAHKQEDTWLAGRVAQRLRQVHGIGVYIDVIDPYSSQAGEDLGDHLRKILGACTQLLAVVTDKTKESWWVPWEIGVATEKDYPIATFSPERTDIPLYLKKWPYLQSDQDLDAYARAAKVSENTYFEKKRFLEKTAARRTATQEFYNRLRAGLGQRHSSPRGYGI